LIEVFAVVLIHGNTKSRKEGFSMSKVMRFWIFGAIAFVLVAAPLAVAGGKGKGQSDKPPGWEKKEKKGIKGDISSEMEKKGLWIPPWLGEEEEKEWHDGRPPGWAHGEKRGWGDADMPPGLAKKGDWLPPGLAKKRPPEWHKWDHTKKERWEEEIEETIGIILGRGRHRKDFSDEDLYSALLSIEASARNGVPIRHTLDLVEKAMDKGIKGRGIETATRAMAYGVGKDIDFEQLGHFIHRKLDEGVKNDELSIEIYQEIVRRHEHRLKAKGKL
jgi:hypothetical protein